MGDWVALRGELAVAVLPRGPAPSSARSPAARRRPRWWRPTSTSSSSSTRSPARPGCAGSSATSPSPGAAGRRRSSSSPRPTSATTSPAAVEAVAEDALGVEVLAGQLGRPGRAWTPSRALLGPGRTAAMVGPVGRREVQPGQRAGRPDRSPTPARSASDGRGRHTTTARELHLLPGGGLLVDTPGMRELALYDDADGRGHRLRRRHRAGRRLPVPRLRAPRPNPGARSPPPSTTAGSTRPASPPGASCRPRRTASCCASTPAPGPQEQARLRSLPPRAAGAAQPPPLSPRGSVASPPCACW